MIKCVVKDCVNDSSQGMFVGLLCSPCHHYISGDYESNSQVKKNADTLHKLIKELLLEELIASWLIKAKESEDNQDMDASELSYHAARMWAYMACATELSNLIKPKGE